MDRANILCDQARGRMIEFRPIGMIRLLGWYIGKASILLKPNSHAMVNTLVPRNARMTEKWIKKSAGKVQRWAKDDGGSGVRNAGLGVNHSPFNFFR